MKDKAELKSKQFSSSLELCMFVNANNLRIESIQVFNNELILFYWE